MALRYLLGGIHKLLIDAPDPERLLDSETPAVGGEIGALVSFGLVHPDLPGPVMEAQAHPVAHEGHATRAGVPQDAAADPGMDSAGGALREGSPM
jgi:hypothetical protein